MKFTFSLLLAGVIAVSSLSTVQAQTNIFSPGDAVLGIQRMPLDDSLIEVGSDVIVNPGNTWPGGENPTFAIDRTAQKYLNFAGANPGIIVTPGTAASVASSLTLWTANDSEGRDPASYEVYGSNDVFTGAEAAGSTFALSGFSLISSGDLALPSDRTPGGTENPLIDANSQTVSFANSTAYNSYLVMFPTYKGPDTIFQIAEVQLNYEAAAIPEPGSLLALAGLGLVGLVRRRKS